MRKWELAPNFGWELILANKDDLYYMVLQKEFFLGFGWLLTGI